MTLPHTQLHVAPVAHAFASNMMLLLTVPSPAARHQLLARLPSARHLPQAHLQIALHLTGMSDLADQMCALLSHVHGLALYGAQ